MQLKSYWRKSAINFKGKVNVININFILFYLPSTILKCPMRMKSKIFYMLWLFQSRDENFRNVCALQCNWKLTKEQVLFYTKIAFFFFRSRYGWKAFDGFKKMSDEFFISYFISFLFFDILQKFYFFTFNNLI